MPDGAPAAGGDGDVVRVASWNIRDLTGDPLAVREVLRVLDADVVCLQEVPRRPVGRLLRTSPLARAAGLRHVVGGRGSGGTAVLAAPRVQVEAARSVRLPVPHWYARRRGAALTAVRLGRAALSVASVHLPLHGGDRLEHARRVGEALRSGPPARVAELVTRGEVVVAGDLNEPPGSPAWTLLTRIVVDHGGRAGATFPAAGPDRRIDAVLVGRAFEVLDYGDGGVDSELVARASDHRPVLAVLRRC